MTRYYLNRKPAAKRVNENVLGNGDWKYQGSKVDKYIWYLKKDAQKEQEKVDILNQCSDMIRNGEITRDELYDMVRRGEFPDYVLCIGVQRGDIWPNKTRKDGWPSVAYLEKWFQHANAELDGGFDDDWIGSNENYSISDLWDAIDQYLYRKELEKTDILGRPSLKSLKEDGYQTQSGQGQHKGLDAYDFSRELRSKLRDIEVWIREALSDIDRSSVPMYQDFVFDALKIRKQIQQLETNLDSFDDTYF